MARWRLILLVSSGLAGACSSTSSHSVSGPSDSAGGANGSGGTSAAAGRGGSSGSAVGGTSGASGSSGSGAGAEGDASAAGGTAGSAAGGTSGSAGSAGASGSAGAAASGGSAGSAGSSGSAGSGGSSASGGNAGSGGRGGSGGSAGADAGVDGGATTWCGTRARPSGVLAVDYRCLDFESGLPPTTQWTRTLSGTGALAASTARASSLPQSLSTQVGAAAGVATLDWNDVGSTGISSLSLAADVNPSGFAGVMPPWTGSVDLMCVAYGSGEGCLSYTRGADLEFANGYTGYFITHIYSGGPAFLRHCIVMATLTPNLWTRVEVRTVQNPTSIQVFVAGTQVGTCPASFTDDTVSDMSIGVHQFPDAAGMTVYYDNVVATVRR